MKKVFYFGVVLTLVSLLLMPMALLYKMPFEYVGITICGLIFGGIIMAAFSSAVIK